MTTALPALTAGAQGTRRRSGVTVLESGPVIALPGPRIAGLLPARVPARHVVKFVSPYPYFGGKSKIAAEVWRRFGDVPNYVEPFFGSGAMLLSRPHLPRIETVNDKDGYISNFWRAVQAEPETVARYADWPVNENDLHARHWWLVGERDNLTARLEGDPAYYDAKVAGWWVWGMCAWIGSGFCSSVGPWKSVEGALVNTNIPDGVKRQLPHLGNAGQGINRQRPHLGDAGQGINRQLPHLGNAGRGINRKLPHLGDAGRGINRKRPTLGSNGRGMGKYRGSLYGYFDALSTRLRYVRVCSGDWKRVLGDSPTTKLGLTAIFLDPPYTHEGRDTTLYTHDHNSIAVEVRDWAIAHGDNPMLRIAYCGYQDGYEWPDGWTAFAWTPRGGFDGQRKSGVNGNRFRETVWFSPSCISVERAYTPAFPALIEAGAAAVQESLL